MTVQKLKYLSEAKLQELREGIDTNLERYSKGNFSDLTSQYGWEVESNSVFLDDTMLHSLDGVGRGEETETKNSAVVFNALEGMTPSLAQEERVWVRLCHVECLTFSRNRWLRTSEGEDLARDVRKHFFASGRTGSRDDNAIGRLWWNFHIAKIALPDNPQRALRVILGKADTRLNLVERTAIGSRVSLLRNVVRTVENEKWLSEDENHFRAFMRIVNRDGGGMLFEAQEESSIIAFLGFCLANAKSSLSKA